MTLALKKEPRSLSNAKQELKTAIPRKSTTASATEQFKEFKKIRATHTNPVQVQDEEGTTTCFCIYVNAGPSDNPMQSEVTGHIGGKGSRFCRKCQVGGTQNDKATNDGHHALFESGLPRAKEDILSELESQVKLACSGVAQQTGVKDMYTQYWIDQLISRFKQMKKDDPTRSNTDIEDELVQWTRANSDKIYSFDPTRDTPVEILHTILLGIVRYIWHISHTPWTDEQKRTCALCLQSTTTYGLSIHAIRANYIMQYAGSLIGCQFKTIVQTNIFHVHGLVTDHQFMAWRAAEIRNLAEFMHLLPPYFAVANGLDIFAVIDPSKIVTKIKYHLLIHLDDDTVEFGPLLGVITKIFECFNGVFRFCSILSNHLARSRDIAIQLGDQEGLKHRLTGGWWNHGSSRDWCRAGPGVRHFMGKHPILQRLLGWTERKPLVHGMLFVIQRHGLKTSFGFEGERVSYKLEATNAAHTLNFGGYSAKSAWFKCRHVISESLDQCFIGSWVFAESATDKNCTVSGCISEILQNVDSVALVVLELFQVLSRRDKRYGMPILVRQNARTIFSILPAKNIKFNFNAQHNCYSAKCEATGVHMQMQERVEAEKTENFIIHNPLDRYIINSHTFHNAHLLRATLPRNLLAPVPLFEDRRQKHDELATVLRSTVETKRVKRKAAVTLKKTESRGRH
ncbi:hypothetical protein B0H11DRAFT_2421034 [Mycena galericulata]|nr:hypothetical protein B0H11DRAFT_2421034 [Mycena galericulata]